MGDQHLVNHFLGIVSQTLFVVCYLPQIIKIWRTKDVRAISRIMLMVLISAELLSICYYSTLTVIPIWALIQVSASCIMALTLLTLCLVYGMKK